MTGLGTVEKNNGLYLSVAGGYIWNRNAEVGDPNYATQKYTKADGEEAERKGAQYATLSGRFTNVLFRTHDKYGENINATITAGGENYILSISTGSRNCTDLMKALLVCDLSKDILVKPYDFIGRDKKRAQGISFKQDGDKLNLRVDGAPDKDAEWFKTSDKKKVRRFFEDLSEWFVEQVKEKVIPQLEGTTQEEPSGLGAPIQESTNTQEESNKAPSMISMKKAIKEYIAENYEGEVMPKLDKVGVLAWYDLVLAEEELPFDNGMDSDLDSELDNLLGDDLPF